MRIHDTVYKYLTDKKKKLTYQDYLSLPDDGNRYEIFEGELIMTPAPKISHQEVSKSVGYELVQWERKTKLGKVFYAPVDVLLSEKSIVQPDLIVILKENYGIITKENIQGAPDLVIEIVLPSSGYYDMFDKKELYEKYGVKEYWIVDPERGWVEVYVLKNGKFQLSQRVEKQGKIESKILNDFSLEWETVFGSVGTES
ncbi:MAG: Uma2 family endonuclease [Calditrichia bacterium]